MAQNFTCFEFRNLLLNSPFICYFFFNLFSLFHEYCLTFILLFYYYNIWSTLLLQSCFPLFRVGSNFLHFFPFSDFPSPTTQLSSRLCGHPTTVGFLHSKFLSWCWPEPSKLGPPQGKRFWKNPDFTSRL